MDPRLLRYARSTRGFIALAVILGVVTALLVIAQARLLADVIVSVSSDGAGWDEVRSAVLLLAAVFAGRAAVVWLAEVAAVRAAARDLGEVALLEQPRELPIRHQPAHLAVLAQLLHRAGQGRRLGRQRLGQGGVARLARRQAEL